MFKNYLIISFRSMSRNKIYAFINILGLAIGLACFTLLFLYIQDELRFDQFHTKKEQIVRIVESINTPELGIRTAPVSSGPLGQALAGEFAEVEKYTGLIRSGQSVNTLSEERRFNVRDYYFVQEDFLEIFDFKVLQGDPKTALEDPKSMILTQELAEAYFGEENPIGKTIHNNRAGEMIVSAVVEAPPQYSHIQFEMLMPINNLMQSDRWKGFLGDWSQHAVYTYLLLRPDTDIKAFEGKIANYLEKHIPEGQPVSTLSVQKLNDIHFQSSNLEFLFDHTPGNLNYLYTFIAIALFLIFIASINYMNLATARALHRAREIGMRKVIGANRIQLIFQFLGESVVTSLLALAISILLVDLSLASFSEIALKELTFDLSQNPTLLLTLISLGIITGLVSGSVPAFYLSSFSPVNVLKNQLKSGKKSIRLRQGLVITQFALSIGLIASTIVVYQQLSFIQNNDLGFQKEQMVIVDINSGRIRNNFEAIKTEFLKDPRVEAVAVTNRVPGEWKQIREVTAFPKSGGKIDSLRTYFYAFDKDVLSTYRMKLVSGNNFRGNIASDSNAVIINETAARLFGWEDDALGKRLSVPNADYDVKVIGVIEDFHFQSLHEAIAPVIIGFRQNPVHGIDYFSVRINGKDIPEVISYLSEVHADFDQETPVEYHFLDQQLERFYQNEERAGKIFGAAALLTIFIACMGLFGLAAFTVEQRTREIGIRKVLGASVSNITLLISKQFMVQIAIAFLLSAPVAWYFMSQWLQNFAYRIELTPQSFLFAGFLGLLVAMATIGYRSVKAALANPADSIGGE